MVVQFRNARQAVEGASRVSPAPIACVRVGEHSTVQGELVWQRGDLACVRVISEMFIGKRIWPSGMSRR